MADTAATANAIDGHTPSEIARYMVVYYAVLFGIVWYDWAVLISKEYRKIWRANWSLAKVAYLLNRYCMLALTVVVFAGELRQQFHIFHLLNSEKESLTISPFFPRRPGHEQRNIEVSITPRLAERLSSPRLLL
jgi:hypothetical protein